MRALFVVSDAQWSGSARVFVAAARGLAARGYQVTAVCQPETAVEQRLASSGIETVAVDLEGTWRGAARRLRRVLEDRFVEVVFVHGERDSLVAASATRMADRGAVVRRVRVGETLTMHWRGKLGGRLAATGFVFPSEEELRAAPPLPERALGAVRADVGVDIDEYQDVEAVDRASVGAAGTGIKLIACHYDPTARSRVATVFRTIGLLAPRHPNLRLVLVGPGSDDEGLRMHAAALGITPLAERSAMAQRYVADGIGGVLLPPNDAPTTAAMVTGFLADEERRAAMGNAAHVRVARDFRADEMVDAFARVTDAARDRTKWVT